MKSHLETGAIQVSIFPNHIKLLTSKYGEYNSNRLEHQIGCERYSILYKPLGKIKKLDDLEKYSKELDYFYSKVLKLLENSDEQKKIWIHVRNPYKASISGITHTIKKMLTPVFPNNDVVTSYLKKDDNFLKFFKSNKKLILTNIHCFKNYLAIISNLMELFSENILNRVIIWDLDEYDNSSDTTRWLVENHILAKTYNGEILNYEDKKNSINATVGRFDDVILGTILNEDSMSYLPGYSLNLRGEYILYNNLKTKYKSYFFDDIKNLC